MRYDDGALLTFPTPSFYQRAVKPLVFPAVVIGLLVAFLVWRMPFWAPRPAVFVDMSFEEASAKATKDGKLLIVDAMASWCGPCKVMDADTWTDPDLIAWLGKHAVAFQFDVDKQPDLARRFGITAMPTIIVLRDGDEVDRTTGGKVAFVMIEWLESL